MKHYSMALLLLLVSCASAPTTLQIAQWKAAAQAAVVVLASAEKITTAEADDLTKLIDTGDWAGSMVIVSALAKAGKITVAEAQAILRLIDLLQATLRKTV